jgi:hypothetical protein
MGTFPPQVTDILPLQDFTSNFFHRSFFFYPFESVIMLVPKEHKISQLPHQNDVWTCMVWQWCAGVWQTLEAYSDPPVMHSVLSVISTS